MNKEIKIITTVSVCLIAVFSSFMYVYAHTLQRSEDFFIRQTLATVYSEKQCADDGGKAHRDVYGQFFGCVFGEDK